MFIILALAATAASCVNNIWYFEHIKLRSLVGELYFSCQGSYQIPEYEKGSKITIFILLLL